MEPGLVTEKHYSVGQDLWESSAKLVLVLQVCHGAALQMPKGREGASHCCQQSNDRNWKQSPRQWHPTPVLLPGKSHGRRSLVGCSPWRRQSRTRLSNFTFTFHFHALEKEMATHSSVLTQRIQGWGSLVGCYLWGHTESDTTEVTQQQQQLSFALLSILLIFHQSPMGRS